MNEYSADVQYFCAGVLLHTLLEVASDLALSDRTTGDPEIIAYKALTKSILRFNNGSVYELQRDCDNLAPGLWNILNIPTRRKGEL